MRETSIEVDVDAHTHTTYCTHTHPCTTVGICTQGPIMSHCLHKKRGIKCKGMNEEDVPVLSQVEAQGIRSQIELAYQFEIFLDLSQKIFFCFIDTYLFIDTRVDCLY